MKKLPILAMIVCVIFIVGCSVASVIFGFLISIGLGDKIAETICNEITDDPLLNKLCEEGIISIFFGLAPGTIEIHNENGQWVTLTSEPKQFDLLKYPGKQQVMVYREDIPPGKYDKIRIDLQNVQIQTKDGIYTTVIPDKELIFDVNIEVNRNQRSGVELNLDLAKSLHGADGDKIIFAPVIDIKSRKNIIMEKIKGLVNADAIYNNELFKLKSGTLIESKTVGMDLDGKMKNNFVLDKNLKLAVENNKVVIKKPASLTSESTVKSPTTETSSSVSTQTSAGITGATVTTQPETIQTETTASTEKTEKRLYSVEVEITGIDFDWKGTWGKITRLDYTIKNNGEGTIKPDYFIMVVEGYGNFEKKIPLPSSSQKVESKTSISSTATVSHGFAYSSISAGDLENVLVSVDLYDSENKLLGSFSGNFNLEGETALVDKGALAKCLSEEGVVIYGVEWSPHYQNQKKTFGSAFEEIDYIDCDKYPDKCEVAGIQGYPTWVIKGMSYPGEQSLSRLFSLAGCSSTPKSTEKFIINAKKWRFDPGYIKVDEGDRVKLIIISELPLNFVLPFFDIKEEFLAGEIKTLEFTANEKGTFEFSCGTYCTEKYGIVQGMGMKGKLVVD